MSDGPSGFDWVAVYAAAVATVVGLWPIYQYFSSRRRKLAVDVFVGALHHPLTGTTPIINFRARNTGSLPIHVRQCGLAIAQRRGLRLKLPLQLALPWPATDLGSRSFPAVVEPSEAFECFADVKRWYEGPLPQGRKWADYDRVYFIDALGKYHSTRVPADFHNALSAACSRAASSGDETP